MSKIKHNSLLQKSFINSHVDRLPPQKAIFVEQSASCSSAIETMIAEGIGCVLARDSQGQLSGIVTERDILTKLWKDARDISTVTVAQIMTPSPQYLKYHASIAKAIYLMTVGGFRHIPIILSDNSVSIVSVTDFIRFITKRIEARTERREEALEVVQLDGGIEQFFDGELSLLSPSKPVLVAPSTPLEDVIELMITHRIGSIAIGDIAKLRVAGIFTERDLLKKVILRRSEIRSMPVAEFMTPSPVTLQATTSIFYAFQAMTEGKFRHLPIVDYDERVVGMLSIKNMIDFLSKEIVKELSRLAD